MFFLVGMLFFPLTVFVLFGGFQYKLSILRRIRNPNDQEKLRKCEKTVRFLSQEAVIAAKRIETVTKSSLGPILQLFALLPTCGIFKEIGNPKKMAFSDLSFSIMVSIVSFAWSMTFSHCTKDGSIDLSIHLIPRLVLFSSFVMAISIRLFLTIVFGHQMFGSDGF